MNEDTRAEERDQEPRIVVTSPGETPPPDTNSVFRIEYEEARESEDYHGLYHDLDSVVNMTRHLRGALLQQSLQPSGVSTPVDTPEEGLDAVRYTLWDATGWHRDYSPPAWRHRATDEQKRIGWEMAVRIEKILCTVLHEARKRQVEETAETLGEGPERFYNNHLD